MTQKNDTQKSTELKEAVKSEMAFNTPDQELQTSNEAQPPAIVESQSAQVMNALVAQLNSGALAPEQLSMVLDAQERVLDRQAKQDFNISMAKCQSEMPEIIKSLQNKQTNSNYEGLDGLNKIISPVYTSNGFGVTFDTADCPREDFERVTAELMHKGGWSKNYHYDLPFDVAGIKGAVNKTKMHATGSTMSYGRRYLLKMIFNLTTSDEIDDDGNSASIIEYITEDQQTVINDLIEEVSADRDKFLTYLNVASLDKCEAQYYDRAIKALEAKRG